MEENAEGILLFCVSNRCVDDLLKNVADLYRVELYSYNNIAKRYGLYLKPVHIAVKRCRQGTKVYHYYGRYWYRIEYRGGKLVWRYVGKEKPLNDMPDPPLNPFIIIKILKTIYGEKVCIYVDSEHCLQDMHKYFVMALDNSPSCSHIDRKAVLSRIRM